jgi:AraC-like DNA-binding protein
LTESPSYAKVANPKNSDDSAARPDNNLNMSLSLFNSLQTLLCVLSLLLGLYVLSVKRSLALATFFFVTALHTILRLADEKIFGGAFIGFTFPLSFLYGSLIFITIRELLFHSQKSWWPHFLPAAIALGLKLFGIANPMLFGISIAIVQIIYLGATFNLVFRYSRVSSSIHSTSPIGLIWLIRGLGLYTLIVCYQMLRYIIDPLVLEEDTPLHLIFHATTSAIFAAMILQIMRYPEMLKALAPEDLALEQIINRPAGATNEAQPGSEEKTDSENASEFRQIMQRIDLLMAEQKPFREPELSLNDMAERLDIPARIVSQAINSTYHTNFPDYINRARVEEAKRLMESPEWSRHSLLDIGLEAGFNSKSSFNLMFKRIANTTPSAYRRIVRNIEAKSASQSESEKNS